MENDAACRCQEWERRATAAEASNRRIADGWREANRYQLAQIEAAVDVLKMLAASPQRDLALAALRKAVYGPIASAAAPRRHIGAGTPVDDTGLSVRERRSVQDVESQLL